MDAMEGECDRNAMKGECDWECDITHSHFIEMSLILPLESLSLNN